MPEDGWSPDQQDVETIHRMASESSKFFESLAQALERLKELFAGKEGLPA